MQSNRNTLNYRFVFAISKLTLICQSGLRNLSLSSNCVFLSQHHDWMVFFSLSFLVNFLFPNYGYVIYFIEHKTHCVYTLVHRESHCTLYLCVLEGKAYLDVWPVLYLCLSYKCPPSDYSRVCRKKHWFIGLTAFLDNSGKNLIRYHMECWFVSILAAACQVCPCLTEFPDGLKPSAPARQMNLKQAMTFLRKSAF